MKRAARPKVPAPEVVRALRLAAAALSVGTDGLPQSVQVIGGRHREGLCLDAAAALERTLGSIRPIDPW